ncbi:MAG: hypothetical protein KDA24_12225 [Deltaproteobacteria bacterium]|nr:hypothetical protein [Deltaproteobacteria bacterium]
MLDLSRREILILLGAGLVGCGVDLDLAPDATFDEVLDALHATAPLFDNGLANHGPMAAETLVELGLSDRVAAYIEDYASRLEWRGNDDLVTAADRPASLGDTSRAEGWIAGYEAEVDGGVSALDLLRRDWAMLAPGLVGAGWHGLLRVAHAVRSLEREDTPSRHRELAHGLGLLGAAARPLPGTPESTPQLPPLAALAAVPVVSPASRVTSGYIVDRLAPVDDLEGFADAVNALDLEGVEATAAVSELCAAAARMYLDVGGRSIHLLHGVTGTSALRLLFGVLDEEARRLGLGYGFAALAALRAAHGADPTGESPPAGTTETELRDAAAEASDEHAIKLIEAALREYAAAPNPELLAAAHDFALT